MLKKTFYIILLNVMALAASPIERLPLNLAESNFPKVNGKVVQAVRYRDATGENLILLTETDIISNAKPGADYPWFPPRSKELYAYRFLISQSAEQVWRVTDFVRECDMYELTASFIHGSLRITDLDNNGIAEIWMVYQLACKGDIAPRTMKIIMYEGDRKYAVRGESLALVADYGDPEKNGYAGGDYALDASFNSAPPGFTPYALELWEKYKQQYIITELAALDLVIEYELSGNTEEYTLYEENDEATKERLRTYLSEVFPCNTLCWRKSPDLCRRETETICRQLLTMIRCTSGVGIMPS